MKTKQVGTTRRGAGVDYRALSELRFRIRTFLTFSEVAARAVGLEPQQHQLLLAVKGLPLGLRPTIGTLAVRLQLRHHTVVGLVDRLVAAGLVERRTSASDRREILIAITRRGGDLLRRLSLHHTEELRRVGPLLVEALRDVVAPPRRPARVASAAVGRARVAS